MAITAITGTVKQVDSNGNEESTAISLVDVYATFNAILVELKKISLHLSVINDKIIEDKDI